jgi:hypothetical protein
LSGGERHEQKPLPTLLETGAIRRLGRGRPRLRPKRVAGDKGYSSQTVRRYLARRGIGAVIPRRKDEPQQRHFDRAAYRERSRVEHTLRFFKQTLNWTAPRVRLPEQADRWTWLVLLAYTHLLLARPWVGDQCLPRERRLELGKLTPNRVRRALSSVRPLLGTPANAPKPCGCSPGRPRRRRSEPAPLCPVLKKAA